ncbi:MAG: protein kinase domain-containing protein [Planctomycetota bacterium]
MRGKTSIADFVSDKLNQACEDSDAKVKAHKRRKWRGVRDEVPALTLANLVHFIIAVFMWPLFLAIAIIWSIGDFFNFLKSTLEATISSTYWFARLMREQCSRSYLHKNSPEMLRLKGRRRAFGAEAKRDWSKAGTSLLNIGRAWSSTFGLGGLYTGLERRAEKANEDWRRYVATTQYGQEDAPKHFPEEYEVVDELQPGGSSARIYVVRKAGQPTGKLYVLKYFDLRKGGNLESVIRESQAASLAQKLGLIVESQLGDQAFWYVMPYYHGETLTEGVMRNIKKVKAEGGIQTSGHQRVSLGYVHQLLQIIAQYHESGVFHKDIKPDNLIINGEKIYLVDIGLMTPLSSMHQLTTHGTEYFRDPMMVKLALEGKEVREVNAAKFDVYSIGAVLYFALSGDFPTSGALSRLPNDVPMAVQWVVNRAMTGMEQRYENARAMLTDVDYLCWASSQGTLADVKPADLPSFKGMPVPSHLQPTADQNNYTRKLEAAPGGYGQWYSAPAYKKKGGFGFRTAAAVLFLVGGLAAIGLLSLGVLTEIGQKFEPVRQSSPDSKMASLLPKDKAHLKPVFVAIDRELGREGVDIKQAKYEGQLTRLQLVPSLTEDLATGVEKWQGEIFRDIKKAGGKDVPKLFGQRRFVLVDVEQDAADKALSAGIGHELGLEISKREIAELPTVRDEDLATMTSILTTISDDLAVHREFTKKFAEGGTVPPTILAYSIEQEAGKKVLSVRVIYPGRESRMSYPFE